MRLLAVDTSTECCSAALLLDSGILLRTTLTDRGHAELILPMVEELLAEAGVELADLDGLAFGRGPGAFTGLRIAAGVAQGLALGAGLKVAPVSSLAAVAEQVPVDPGARILVCNDARMGEVYWAEFERQVDGSMNVLAAESVSPPDRVAVQVASGGQAAGNAWVRYPDLRERLESLGWVVHDGFYPRADAVARLGVLELAAGRGVEAEAALPVYVRDDVARAATGAVTAVS